MRIRRLQMWAVMIAGYLTFGRDFAYLGIPPLYIGEAYLCFKILQNKGNWISRFVNDCLRGRLLPLAIAMHLTWGIIEVARSWDMDRDIIQAMRTAAFNYYPLYLLVGISIGATMTMATLIRVLKIVAVAYAIRTLMFLAGVNFATSANTALVPVMLVAIWNHLRGWKWKYPMLVLSMIQVFFSGTHGRGTLLGFVAGLVATSMGSPARLLRWGVAGLALTIMLIFVGPMIPGPQGGAPPLDPIVQLARVVASDHPDLAIRMIRFRMGGRMTASYKAEIDNLYGAQGTASWRQSIWTSAMRSLNTRTLLLMGQGEATSLADVTPNGEDIHTPHNICIYCIFYTGWIGMGIFSLLLFAVCMAGQQLKSPDLRTLYSATFWCALLVAITGNYLETPFGAIPFYLFAGVLIGIDRHQVLLSKLSRSKDAGTARPGAIRQVSTRGTLVSA